MNYPLIKQEGGLKSPPSDQVGKICGYQKNGFKLHFQSIWALDPVRPWAVAAL
jgi:hypothetical protein